MRSNPSLVIRRQTGQRARQLPNAQRAQRLVGNAQLEVWWRLAKLMTMLKRPGLRRGLRIDAAAATEHLPVMRNLEVGTLFDVGANKGRFSLLMRDLHPRAVIHAFEPLHDAADRLDRLLAGDLQIIVHRVAAGSGS